jgi:hypothetical protein
MISQSLSSPLLNLELFSIMGWLSKGNVISSKVLEDNMAQLNKVTVSEAEGIGYMYFGEMKRV